MGNACRGSATATATTAAACTWAIPQCCVIGDLFWPRLEPGSDMVEPAPHAESSFRSNGKRSVRVERVRLPMLQWDVATPLPHLCKGCDRERMHACGSTLFFLLCSANEYTNELLVQYM